MSTTAWNRYRRDTEHMAHSYSSILFHVVFSTKERRALMLNYEPLAVGGTQNHLHLLVRLPAQIPVAEAAQKLKANSSRWLKENGSWLGWQQGYGAFSVSPSNVDAVRRYIQNQPEHHRRRSFEEEFLALLVRSEITFEKAEVFE
jgi:putative transposase